MERRPPAGFTLIEALIALAVLSLLLTVGPPSFERLRTSAHMASLRHQLTTSLAFARSAAGAYAMPVNVCPVDAARRCRADAAWEQGWMTYRDRDRSGQPEKPEDILEFVDGPAPGLRVRGSAGRQQARFQADGRSSGSTLTLRICNDDALLGEVILNNAGRPRSTDLRDAGLACEPD